MRRCGMNFASVMAAWAPKCLRKSSSLILGGRPLTKILDDSIMSCREQSCEGACSGKEKCPCFSKKSIYVSAATPMYHRTLRIASRRPGEHALISYGLETATQFFPCCRLVAATRRSRKCGRAVADKSDHEMSRLTKLISFLVSVEHDFF